MSDIKYHDNLHGEQYGADHHLTNNWNPDGPFADNEYIHVYFRLRCPEYKVSAYGTPNFSSGGARDAFYEEIESVIKAHGVSIGAGTEITSEDEKEYIWPHPNSTSGVVRKSKVKTLAEAFSGCKTFQLEWVDVYEDVFDLSDEAYRKYLVCRKDAIRESLLKVFTTRRKNMGVPCNYIVDEPIQLVSKEYHLPRLHGPNYAMDAICCGYIFEQIRALVAEGKLAEMNTKKGKAYRTVTSSKQAQPTEETIETNVGRMPLPEYREIKATQCGFDSYEEMFNAGYRIGNGLDEQPANVD